MTMLAIVIAVLVVLGLAGCGNVYLRGEALEPAYAPTRPTVEVPPYQMTEEELETITSRPPVPCHSAAERTRGFDEVDLCLSDEQACNEAKRCLRCDASRPKNRGGER